MFELVILIAFLSGSPSFGVVEKELTFGPWGNTDCYLRLDHYAEMYESMPGFTVLKADCVPVEKE